MTSMWKRQANKPTSTQKTSLFTDPHADGLSRYVPPRILISSRTSSSEFMRTHRSSSRVSESLQQPIKEPRCVRRMEGGDYWNYKNKERPKFKTPLLNEDDTNISCRSGAHRAPATFTKWIIEKKNKPWGPLAAG